MYSKEEFESELDSRLNEFYHRNIVPLEKEIMRLWGELPQLEDDDILEYKIYPFRPLDPFKESRRIIHHWKDEQSDYYKFFKSLFEECFDKGWITLVHPYNYEETYNYWMYLFGCKENYSFILRKEDYQIIKALEWKGKKNLCIYLINELIDGGYVSTKARGEIIKNHFLPNSRADYINTTKSKFKDLKPADSDIVDELLFELTKRLD